MLKLKPQSQPSKQLGLMKLAQMIIHQFWSRVTAAIGISSNNFELQRIKQKLKIWQWLFCL